jgi:hypothetical protein
MVETGIILEQGKFIYHGQTPKGIKENVKHE